MTAATPTNTDAKLKAAQSDPEGDVLADDNPRVQVEKKIMCFLCLVSPPEVQTPLCSSSVGENDCQHLPALAFCIVLSVVQELTSVRSWLS